MCVRSVISSSRLYEEDLYFRAALERMPAVKRPHLGSGHVNRWQRRGERPFGELTTAYPLAKLVPGRAALLAELQQPLDSIEAQSACHVAQRGVDFGRTNHDPPTGRLLTKEFLVDQIVERDRGEVLTSATQEIERCSSRSPVDLGSSNGRLSNYGENRPTFHRRRRAQGRSRRTRVTTTSLEELLDHGASPRLPTPLLAKPFSDDTAYDGLFSQAPR